MSRNSSSAGARRVWDENADTVAAKIYGPHFEDLARRWCLEHASEGTLAGTASSVRPTDIGCREHKGHELDLVAVRSEAFGTDRIIAIGEAKCTAGPVGTAPLERLEHVRGMLPGDRVGAAPKLLLFSRSGFTDDLRRTADARGDVELIGLERLYHGS